MFSLFPGYSAGGSRACGARPATDSGAGRVKIGDAESKANSLFGGYSAGGSRARGARPATDSGVMPVSKRRCFSKLFYVIVCGFWIKKLSKGSKIGKGCEKVTGSPFRRFATFLESFFGKVEKLKKLKS